MDFFIQYQTDQTEESFEPKLQTLKELKKIIFLLCVESTCIKAFSQILSDCDCITPISEFEIVQDVGNPVSRSTRIQTVSPTQKSTIFFILVLSYNVLSFSGSLGIRIKDISDIIQSEKQREQEGKQKEGEEKISFILQFLPLGNEITCFKKAADFFFKEGKINSTMIKQIFSLSGVDTDSGGSKRVLKKYNKSRKNKYKNKYKKSRKNKRYRRKTIKSK